MSDYLVVIIVTFFGFVGLAALLLVPVYRFLKREEKASETWSRKGDFEHPPGVDDPGSSNGSDPERSEP